MKFNHPYLFKLPIIREKFCCRLDEELYNKTLPINSPRGLAVEGYLQSWAYFKDHFADIRRIFTSFNSNVTNQINRFILNFRVIYLYGSVTALIETKC